jgi:hypothetical protein
MSASLMSGGWGRGMGFYLGVVLVGAWTEVQKQRFYVGGVVLGVLCGLECECELKVPYDCVPNVSLHPVTLC